MATQRNFDRQIWAIESLSVLCSYERDHYTVTEFRVEEWAGNHVNVQRVKQPMRNGVPLNMAYHESFVIGSRGSVKTIYSSFR